ncbi:MAG: ROK family protein [Subdoligranulum sp.]|nr:ROK family protein [Subdoligranulum sp.]
MHTYIPAYLRSKNRGVVLQLFIQHKVLSKADIVKLSNLTFPTVTNVITDFLEMGLVQKTDGVTTAENGLGRKGVQLRLNENAFSTIGIFFEGNYLHVGLMNLLHEVVDRIDYALEIDPSTPEEYAVVSEHMTNAIDTLLQAHPETQVLGVGVGMPGVVDAKNNTFRRWGRLYQFYDLYKTFSCDFPLPVFIENDINAAALGETIIRNDPNFSNLFFFSVGTGTGAGLIINDRIWRGNANYAGDVGMVMNQLDLSGLPENLSALRLNNQINVSALEKHFGVDIAHNTPCGAEKKHEISEYVVQRFLPMLYNLNYILDITHYVLSGSLIDYLGDIVFDCVREHINYLHHLDMIPMQMDVVPSIHRNVGIVGAADIALSNRMSSILN